MAESGDEILVAEGTYTPTSGGSRSASFQLINDVAIYGGFPSGGGEFEDRDPIALPTILSGDLSGNDGPEFSNLENSFHVVTATGVSATAILDGFRITGGNSNGVGPDTTGGGILINGSGAPTIANCHFLINSAAEAGGAVYNLSGAPSFTNCSFEANASLIDGGAIYCSDGSLTLINCAFHGNAATENGGALYNFESSVTVTNCSLHGNAATLDGGAIYNELTSLELANCIIWENAANGVTTTPSPSIFNVEGAGSIPPTYSHCLIHRVDLSSSGTNSFNGDNPGNAPQFVNTVDPLVAPVTGADLHLQLTSPMIGRGSAAANPEATDLDGQERLVPFGIELGAYELQRLTFSPSGVSTAVPNGDEYLDADWLPPLEGLTVTFALQNSTGSLAFDSLPTVDQNGTLRFTLAAHTAGTASFEVQLVDPSSDAISSVIETINISAKDIFYVDASADGDNDGRNWTNAFEHLQDALSSASSGDEIFVAQGTYFPDTTTNFDSNSRSATFRLKNGVAIYGGFPRGGGDGSFTARDPGARRTVLSGDIDGDDAPDFANNDNNSSHVVTGTAVNASALLDGFIITAGNSSSGDGAGLIISGGSPSISNCVFEYNSASASGGAIYNNNSSSPSISGCSFRGNLAQNGGAIYNRNSSRPNIINCSFEGNVAGTEGGAINNNNNSSPIITNCVFQGNAASVGGAFYNRNFSRPIVTNCSFQGNSASADGGAFNNANGSSPTVTNCIVWNNAANGVTNTVSASAFNSGSTPVYSHCLIQNLDLSSSGTNNFDGTDPANDPDFAIEVAPLSAPAFGSDLRLRLDTSPMIGVGDNAANSSPLDLANNPRIQNITIDLGAYEGFLFRELKLPSESAMGPALENLPWTSNELSALGSYFGLLRSSVATPEGSISAKLTKKGAVSGSITYQGLRLKYRGTISGDGSYAEVVTDEDTGRTFNVALQLVSTPNGYQLVGTVSEGATVLDASLDQAAFNKKTNPAPYSGKYTVIIPPNIDFIDDATHPQGAGWATLTVSAGGKVRLAGQLGDLTPVSITSVVSEDGSLQIFKELYRTSPKGSLAGTVTFRDTPSVSDLDGILDWRKQADDAESRYPDGFDFQVTLIGSAFTTPYSGEPILPGINLAEAENSFWGAGGEIRTLHWNAKNKIAATTDPGEKLKISTSTSSGLIKGSYANSEKSFKFKGVAFQKQDIVAGTFPNGDVTGLFTIAPKGLASLQLFDALTSTEVSDGDTLDLGDSGILAGAIAERNVVIENNGDSPLIINSIVVEEGSSFAVVGRAGKIIEPGKSSIITVQFQPTVAGVEAATITLTSNASSENPFAFEVTGNGLAGSSTDGARPAQTDWAGLTPESRSLPLDTTPIGGGSFDPEIHSGRFYGLTTSEEAGLPIVGLASLKVSENAFSGSVVIAGTKHRLKGIFDDDGIADGISSTGLNFNLSIHTVSDIRGDTGVKIIGNISSFTVDLVRSGFSDNNPASFANRYTLILPSVIDRGDGFPSGDGYGTVVVDALGKTKASLVLGDGSKVSLSGPVSVDGEWLLYNSLYRTQPKGFLAGTIHFRETVGVSDFDATLHWVRPPEPKAKRFSRGFTIRQPLVGAIYTRPSTGETALPGLVDSEDNAVFQTGGDLLPDLGLAVTWSTSNKVSYTPAAREKLSIKVNSKSGIVSGSYSDKETGKSLKFGGAILQSQQLITGNHPTASGSESITLAPAVVP